MWGGQGRSCIKGARPEVEVEVGGRQETAPPRGHCLCSRGLSHGQQAFVASAQRVVVVVGDAEPWRSCEEFGFYCRCDKKPSQWLLSKEEEAWLF